MKRNFLISFVLGIFLLASVSAITTLSTPSVCCEKTIFGGTCINTEQSNCDATFQIAPTSCESTSYCKLGTCYDSKEGICMANVPQKVCQEKGGTWSDKKVSELKQCQLGCCIIADQASFVTQVRCKSMSTFFGVSTDYRPEITSELSCIETANQQDQGACVFYEGGLKTCEFTTRGKCGGKSANLELNTTLDEDTSKKFYKDVLCSAEELATECARQVTTGCDAGKVYFYDSCGNKENIFSSDKDKSWNKGRVAKPEEVCGAVGQSKNCGNCDYLLGGRCAEYENVLGIGKPAFGNYYCKATSCTDRDGNERKNGESWCVYDSEVGNARDPAGSRHYREICSDGEIKVEACEDFRNQVCVHSGIDTAQGEFSTAACRINRWQDCTQQAKKDDCENTDARDCLWVSEVDGINFLLPKSNTTSSGAQAFTNPVSGGFNQGAPSTPSTSSQVSSGINTISSVAGGAQAFNNPSSGNVINHIVGSGQSQTWAENELANKLRTNRTTNESGLCVPMVSPGFKFWEKGDAKAICSQANAICNVNITRTYKKDLLTGDKKLDKVEISENDCLIVKDAKKGIFEVNPDWAVKVNAVCSALGDCGADININGVFTDDGYEWKYDNQSYYITSSDVGLIKSASLGKGTGAVIGIDYIINNEYKLNQDDYVYVKSG